MNSDIGRPPSPALQYYKLYLVLFDWKRTIPLVELLTWIESFLIWGLRQRRGLGIPAILVSCMTDVAIIPKFIKLPYFC